MQTPLWNIKNSKYPSLNNLRLGIDAPVEVKVALVREPKVLFDEWKDVEYY